MEGDDRPVVMACQMPFPPKQELEFKRESHLKFRVNIICLIGHRHCKERRINGKDPKTSDPFRKYGHVFAWQVVTEPLAPSFPRKRESSISGPPINREVSSMSRGPSVLR